MLCVAWCSVLFVVGDVVVSVLVYCYWSSRLLVCRLLWLFVVIVCVVLLMLVSLWLLVVLCLLLLVMCVVVFCGCGR